MSKTAEVIKAIVFDFDGVLVESNTIKETVFAELFGEFPDHGTLMLQFHKSNRHRPRKEKFEYASSLFPQEKREEIFRYMNLKFSSIVEEKVIQCREVEGTGDLLKKLSKRLPLYIASVTPEDELQKIIHKRGWKDYFQGVYGTPPTPKAEVIQKVQVQHALSQKEVLFVGDSITDYEVAKQTKVQFVSRVSENKFDAPGIHSFLNMKEFGFWLDKELEEKV